MADAPAENLVWVKRPDGTPVRIENTPAELQKAANAGYTQASQDEANHAERVQQMSGVGGTALAAGTGLASALSGGASDVIAHQLGVGEDVKAAQEAHPVIHGASELAGYAAPVVGEFGATRALGDLAKGVVTRAVETEGSGLAKRAAVKALAGAAESIPYTAQQTLTESALGDPSVTAEHLLSTLGTNALMFGAFTGGASVAGDLAKPGFEALASGSKKLRDVFEKYYGKLGPEYEQALRERNMVQGALEGPAAPSASAKPDKSAAVREMTEALNDTNRGLREAQADFAPIRAQTREAALRDVPVEAAQKEAADVVNRVGQRIEELRQTSDVFSKSVLDAAGQKLDAVAGRISGAESSHAIYEELDTLRGHLADLSRAGKGVAASPSIEAAQRELKGLFSDVRNSLENTSVWGDAAVAQAEHNAAYSKVADAREQLMKAIGQKVGRTAEVSPQKVSAWLSKAEGAEADVRWRLFQNYQEAVSGYNDMAQKYAGRLGQGPEAFDKEALEQLLARNQKAADAFKDFGPTSRGFKAAEAAGKADDAFRAAQAQSAGPGATGGHSDLLGLGVVSALLHGHTGIGAALMGAKGIMKGVHVLLTEPQKTAAILSRLEALGQKIGAREDAIVKAIGRGAEVTGGALAKVGGVTKEAHDDESFRKQVDGIRQMAGDPQAMMERAGHLYGGLTNAAPATTAAAGVATANAAQYLASTAPATTLQAPMGPVRVKVPPTQAMKFQRRVQIANDPVAIMGHVANGTLTNEHMQTMQALYPGMLRRQQGKVLDRVTKMSSAEVAAMKPNQRASVSLFLGMPVTNAFTPQGLQGYQRVYAQIAAQPVAPKAPSARQMQSPSAWMTRQQRVVAGRSH